MKKSMWLSILILLSLVSVNTVYGAPETVRLHMVPGLYAAPLYAALDKGFFEQAGIKLEMKPTTAVTESVPFLSSGQIDVATGGYGAGIFSAISEGIDIRIVAPMALVPADRCPNPLLVRKDGGIKSVKELKGKKIACAGALVGGSGFQLIQILEANGLSGNDVVVSNLRAPDQVIALSQGGVDAAMSTEPFASKLLKEGIGTFVACPKPGTSVTGVVFSGKFMKERPQAARDFMVALMKGFREIQGQQFFSNENLQIFTKHTGVAPEVIREMATYEWDPNMTLGTATLVEQQAVYMRYGALKYKTPLKTEQFVDESYVKHALSVLGPYKGK